MATQHYAWTRIVGSDKDEKPLVVARGEKVSASSLNVSSKEFDEMVRAGSIRTKPFPTPDGFEGSAVDYLREQLREATSVGEESIEEAEAISELSELEKVSG